MIIKGQKFDFTYQELQELYYQVITEIRNGPDDKQRQKEVEKYLHDFELSNRQFPDELFEKHI